MDSHAGDLYGDESAWTRNFEAIQEVASAMALQAQYRETYFTIPSTMDHDFYQFWSGATYNKDRFAEEQIKIDISHDNLKHGKDCDDGYWRQIINIHDAIERGCNLFNLDKVKRKYSPARFAMLCLCQFTDHTQSVFNFNLLHAAIVLVAPPSNHNNNYRVVFVERMDDSDYDQQAERIIGLTKQFNIAQMHIDNQGVGDGIYQKLAKAYPGIVDKIRYTPESKAQMVVKMQTLLKISAFRLMK